MALRQHRTDDDAANARLDKYLATLWPDLTRSHWQRLIDEGRVTLDGAVAKSATRLEPDQQLLADLPEVLPPTLVPDDTPLDVVYEDADVLVIDKPAGLVVHPAPGHAAGTLANIVIGRWEGEEGEETLRPGIVHRLDKDTSGLMVVAKNPMAQANLAQQIGRREMRKQYLLLVHGNLQAERGTIEAPIGRDPRDRKRMAVVGDGRDARTGFQVLEVLEGYTLVEATLETGRTHQIRVHFRAIGHPLIGDPVYGTADVRLPLRRQFLHSHRLGFRLPSTGEWVEFERGLPADLEACLETARAGR
ncbi:MAG: RluA family pseudouridine synthase [Chloroflexota bacterium]